MHDFGDIFVKILVINSGSSSLKFQLFSLPDFKVIASGLLEESDDEQSPARMTFPVNSGETRTINTTLPTTQERPAISAMLGLLRAYDIMDDENDLAAIGHRVVHGGEAFHEPVLIDEDVIKAIEKLIPLAPLHNPANLSGIRLLREHVPDIPQVAVFDTAFHQTIPEHGFLYALPHELYTKHKIRRYGFHGTSHGYVARQAAEYLDRPLDELNIISLHLGNGASAAAIKNGKCIDTSMGLTPLEGLVMGTRSGDLDPAILFYLSRETGMNMDELDNLLNKASGLKGICDENDMRTITKSAAQGDQRAQLALAMFCYRIKKYIGSYMAALGGVDCIIFTGGIGENSAIVRKMSCAGLHPFGITIDQEKNALRHKKRAAIHSTESSIQVLVVPTNEELEIARQTLQVLTTASLHKGKNNAI